MYFQSFEMLESVFEIKCDSMEFKTLFFMIYCVWVFSFFSWVLSATSDILLPFNKIRTYRKTKGANMASGNNVLMVKVLLINSCSEHFLWNRTYSQTFVVVSWISKRGTFTCLINKHAHLFISIVFIENTLSSKAKQLKNVLGHKN